MKTGTTEKDERYYMQWLTGGDTGVSSITMLGAIVGFTVERPDTPRDIADVGRCVRLLMRFPELRESLHKVYETHPCWMPYIDCWNQIEKLYKECSALEREAQQSGLKFNWQKSKTHQTAWNVMERLGTASYYLKGFRAQGSLSVWKTEAKEKEKNENRH